MKYEPMQPQPKIGIHCRKEFISPKTCGRGNLQGSLQHVLQGFWRLTGNDHVAPGEFFWSLILDWISERADGSCFERHEAVCESAVAEISLFANDCRLIVFREFSRSEKRHPILTSKPILVEIPAATSFMDITSFVSSDSNSAYQSHMVDGVPQSLRIDRSI